MSSRRGKYLFGAHLKAQPCTARLQPSPLSTISIASAAPTSSAAAPLGIHTGMWSSPAPLPPLPGRPLSPQLSRIHALSSKSSPSPELTDCWSSTVAFIALHAGAGHLHPTNHSQISSLLQSACNTALQQATTVEEAVVIAVSVLEASPLTNAALGSCLTEEGKVECEASIVFGNGAFGSVGAVTGVDHPV
jgi:hypothetical protein